MHDIDAPTAKRLLRTLPYEEWLPVGRMMIPKGIHTARVGSLEELLWTLKPGAKSLATVRFDLLERGLRERVGDESLADEVARIAALKLSYVEASKAIYAALEERVTRLEKAAEANDA